MLNNFIKQFNDQMSSKRIFGVSLLGEVAGWPNDFGISKTIATTLITTAVSKRYLVGIFFDPCYLNMFQPQLFCIRSVGKSDAADKYI